MSFLYARARAGDAAALRCVVDALRPRLVRMASHYARCTGENPDDLLQEAWVGLLEALPQLDTTIGSPEQYLIQRARWRLLDSVKRARVRRCASLEDALLEFLIADDLEHAQAQACVADFAGRLKDTQRAVLDCLLRGLTWREAGEVLGCTSANVAYHVRQIQRQYVRWNGEPV
jgi:RNA polymerase sigma-70 factor (ECF subfamily)